jgi:hypothetical protein
LPRFGDLEEVPRVTFYQCTSVNRLVTFVFRYRPLGESLYNCHFKLFDFDSDILQANGITPLPPRAACAESSHKRKSLEDDVIEINSSDEDEIDRNMNALKVGVTLVFMRCVKSERCRISSSDWNHVVPRKPK